MNSDNLTPFKALDLAVTRTGSQAAMAKLCDVSQPAVWKWLKESKQLPAEHVLTVERATGVSREMLRPDIYPPGLQAGIPFQTDPLEGRLAPSPDEHSCESRAESQSKADAA